MLPSSIVGGIIHIFAAVVIVIMCVDVQKNAETRLRGVEEVCSSISPTDGTDLAFIFAQRSRTTSAMSSVLGDDEFCEEG